MSNIFKIYYMKNETDVNNIFIFTGDEKEETVNKKMFSDFDRKHENKIVYINSSIYGDDTIQDIKCKILNLEQLKEKTFHEMHLYTSTKIQLDSTIFFNFLSNNENIHFAENYQSNVIDDDIKKSIKVENDKINYDTFKSLKLNDRDVNVYTPIDKLTGSADMELFYYVTNPYNIKSNDNLFSVNTKKNNMVSLFDNDFHQTKCIYLCFASDVFEHNKKNNIDVSEEKLIHNYFPLLTNENITNNDELEEEKIELQDKTKKIIHSNLPYFKNIDMLHNLYDEQSMKKMIQNEGIYKIEFEIESKKDINIPLASIFKNFHATETYPLIKYSSGKNLEKFYRLYSNQTSTDGRKIPFLNKTLIFKNKYKMNLKKSIQIYINVSSDNYIICSFKDNGNIQILYETKEPKKMNEIEQFILQHVNVLLEKMEEYFMFQGYELNLFKSLDKTNIKLLDLSYYYLINVKLDKNKKANLNKKIDCLKNIFTILPNEDMSSDINLDFKRIHFYDNSMEKYPGIKLNISAELDKIVLKIPHFNYFYYLETFPVYLNTLFKIINDEDINNICGLNIEERQNLTSDEDVTYDIEDINEEEIEEDDDDKSNISSRLEYDLDNIFDDDETGVLDDLLQDTDDDNNINVSSIESYNENDDDDDDDDEDGDGDGDGDGDDGDGDGDEDSDDDIFMGGTSNQQNYWSKRIAQRDNIFKKFNYSKMTDNYSRTCPSSQNRQPIILTQEEKNTIDAKDTANNSNNSSSYGGEEHLLKYSSTKNENFYYICPNYWCYDDNSSISPEHIDQTDGKLTSKKCNHGKGEIHKFGIKYTQTRDYKDEQDASGNYKYNYPGFKGDETGDYCLPCCATKATTRKTKLSPDKKIDLNEIRKKKCYSKIGLDDDNDQDNDGEDNDGEDNDGEDKDGQGNDGEDKEETLGSSVVEKGTRTRLKNKKFLSLNILLSNKYPMPFYRAGYLPLIMQKIFQNDHSKCIISEDMKEFDCYLRVGVNENKNQSFLECLAFLRGYYLKKTYTDYPSVNDIKDIITNSITIDKFVTYQNGNLISIFHNNNISKIKINNTHKESNLYKNINYKDDTQKRFFNNIVGAYENFVDYIKSNDNYIDYKYLWDFVCEKNANLFKDGINLIIFEMPQDEIYNYVELICPSNFYVLNKFDSKKPSIILLKQDNYYEPIMHILKKSKAGKIEKKEDVEIFFKNKKLKELFNKVEYYYNKCSPLPNTDSDKISSETLRTAGSLREMFETLNYEVKCQIINYHGKVIAFQIKFKDDVFAIPCYPSSFNPNETFDFFTNDILYGDYETTLKYFNVLQKAKKKLLAFKEIKKVVVNNTIVGLTTSMDYFIPIYPTIPNFDDDDNDISETENLYFEQMETNFELIDSIIFKNFDEFDNERIIMVKQIKLENLFYNAYRHKMRLIINNPNNIELKDKMKSVVDAPFLLYKSKLDVIGEKLQKLTKKFFEFTDIYTNKFIMNLKDDDLVILGLTNKKDKMNLPKNNLIHNGDNEQLYMERLTDEIIRYDNIRMFMFDPNTYLLMIQQDYNLNTNEILIPQSILDKDYFTNMVPDVKNNYGEYNTYDETTTRDKNRNNIFNYEDPVIVKKKNKIVLGPKNEEVGVMEGVGEVEAEGQIKVVKKGRKLKIKNQEKIEGEEEGKVIEQKGGGIDELDLNNMIVGCNREITNNDKVDNQYPDERNATMVIENAKILNEILTDPTKYTITKYKDDDDNDVWTDAITCSTAAIGLRNKGMNKLTLLTATDKTTDNLFYFYYPSSLTSKIITNDGVNGRYQSGGAELDTSISLKPYGLKIKIGETGDFPSSKLKSKVLGSGDIHAYFVKDVDFRKIKKNMPENKGNFTSESGLRDFLQKARYLDNKRNRLKSKINKNETDVGTLTVEKIELTSKIQKLTDEITSIEQNDEYKELKNKIKTKNDEINKATNEELKLSYVQQKKLSENELISYGYDEKVSLKETTQNKLKVIESDMRLNELNTNQMEKELEYENKLVESTNEKHFNTNIGYILEQLIKSGTHITHEGKDYTIGSVSWDGSSREAIDAMGTSMKNVYEVRVDVIILEGKIDMDTMKGKIKSSCKLRRKKIIHSVKRMMGKVKGSMDNFSNYANNYNNNRGTRKMKIEINNNNK